MLIELEQTRKGETRSKGIDVDDVRINFEENEIDFEPESEEHAFNKYPSHADRVVVGKYVFLNCTLVSVSIYTVAYKYETYQENAR